VPWPGAPSSWKVEGDSDQDTAFLPVVPALRRPASSRARQHLPHGDLADTNTTLAWQLRQADGLLLQHSCSHQTDKGSRESSAWYSDSGDFSSLDCSRSGPTLTRDPTPTPDLLIRSRNSLRQRRSTSASQAAHSERRAGFPPPLEREQHSPADLAGGLVEPCGHSPLPVLVEVGLQDHAIAAGRHGCCGLRTPTGLKAAAGPAGAAGPSPSPPKTLPSPLPPA